MPIRTWANPNHNDNSDPPNTKPNPDTNPSPNLTLLIVTARSYDDKKSCLIANKRFQTAYTFSRAYSLPVLYTRSVNHNIHTYRVRPGVKCGCADLWMCGCCNG